MKKRKSVKEEQEEVKGYRFFIFFHIICDFSSEFGKTSPPDPSTVSEPSVVTSTSSSPGESLEKKGISGKLDVVSPSAVVLSSSEDPENKHRKKAPIPLSSSWGSAVVPPASSISVSVQRVSTLMVHGVMLSMAMEQY